MKRRRLNTKRPHRGMSLMELLLVLALLVAVAALALPALSGPLNNYRLRNAADVVRVQWAKARVQAMESGRTYVFRYQLNGNAFFIEPWQLDDDYLESSESIGEFDAAAVPTAAPVTTTTATNFAVAAQAAELPENVLFAGSETDTDERELYLAQTSQQNLAVDMQWSPPIFFYPDGTSSTARLVMTNTRQRFIMLTMRGLTGVVQVSDLLSFEELP